MAAPGAIASIAATINGAQICRIINARMRPDRDRGSNLWESASVDRVAAKRVRVMNS